MQVRYQAAPHTEAEDYSHRVGIESAQNGLALPPSPQAPGLFHFCEQVPDLEQFVAHRR